MRLHVVKDDPTGKVIFAQTDRMREIDEEMSVLEERYWLASGGKYKKKLTEETREMCIHLGKLGAEYWALSEQVNPEYHAMKPVWKKTYGSISQ